MNEQNQALEAPAPAVEADKGATTKDVSASSAQDTQVSSSENQAVEAAQPAGDAATSQAEGDDDGEGEGADDGVDESAAASEGQAEGEPGKKKRRRRRRKKGPHAAGAEGAEGAEGAPVQAGGERPPRHEKPAKEGSAGIYARFFEGAGGAKRHAFTAGEIVAGRVSAINDGAFAVDLFGKATAFVDIFEPREVPAIPDPPPEAVAVESAPATAEAASAAEAASGDGTASAVEGAVDESDPAAQQAVQAMADSAVAQAVAGDDEAAHAVAEPVSLGANAEAPAAAVDAEGVAAEAHAGEDLHGEAEHAEHAEAEPEPEAPPAPAMGSIFRGRIGSVAESGHVVIVNRIVDVPAAKKRLEAAREARRRVRGVVFGFNRGGFDVMVEGIRVFCPASGMSLAPLENPDEVLGQRLEFTLPPTKAGTHGFVVSRRGIIERQQRKAAKALFKSLQPGQRLKGYVTHVRDFGVFVDLGGIEGLVHQSELSFNRGARPADVAKSGDEVEVQVLRIGEGPTRRDRERVSLSMKALLPDPWAQHAEALEPGSVHTGKVTRTTDFGAFIEIVPQVEGLLHISELGRELKHANQAIQEGQELRVVVERVDRKLRRISLSRLSAAEEKAMAAGDAEGKSGKPPKLGAHVTVTVEKVEPMGIIVQFPGVFGRRGRGFIPNAEMGTERGTDHRKGFPPGTSIPIKVVAMDRDGGLRCSRKLLLVEEEKRAVQDYRREAARHGLGTFGDLLRAKLEGKQTP